MGPEGPKKSSKKDDMDNPKKKSGKLSTEKPDEKKPGDLEVPINGSEKKPRKKSTKKEKEQESATELPAEKLIEKKPDEKAEKSKDKDGDEVRLKMEADKQKEIRRKEFIKKYEGLFGKGEAGEEHVRFLSIQFGMDSERINEEIKKQEDLEKDKPHPVRAQNIEDLRQALKLVEREIEQESTKSDETVESKTVGGQEQTGSTEGQTAEVKSFKETDPQKIFEHALDSYAQEKKLDEISINHIRAFTDYRGVDPKELKRQLRFMRLMELNDKDTQLADALTEIIKIMEKKPGAGEPMKKEEKSAVGQEKKVETVPPEEKSKKSRKKSTKKDEKAGAGEEKKKPTRERKDGDGKKEQEEEKKRKDEEGKIKKFMEENKFEDADAIKREIAEMRKNAPREKVQGKFGEIEKIKWDPDTAERHKMLVRSFRYYIEKPENLDKEIVELQKNIADTETKLASGKMPVEEMGAAGEKLDEMRERLELRKKQRGIEPGEEDESQAETGKELMVIRDRVIAEMAQGKSLVERQTELEGMEPRSPQEQAELDYIIRGGRINAIIQIFVNVEGKDSKEYWEKHGASFFEGYEQALKDATAGGVKEPDAEKFGLKLLEYLPDEGNPKMAELKKGGGEALKKITDAIGEIFKEKNPAAREEKSGESKELQQIKDIMGEDGFKEFMKTLLEAKERKEKGELTPEEAAKQKEKLEKAKGAIGGSMEKAWSIAGLVGIMLLLGLIFMIIVELEALDFMLKKTKGGKGGIF